MNKLKEHGDNKLMNKFIADFFNQVYHGTISIHKESLKNGIDINRGFDSVDFGKGFYTTTNYQQAKLFAEINAKRYNLIQQRKNAKNSNGIFKLEKVSFKKFCDF